MSWDEELEGPPLEIARTDHTPLRVMADRVQVRPLLL